MQILQAFHPKPRISLSPSSLPLLSLSSSICLLPGKINRSALKFSVLSVKIAKRLHKAPTKLWSVNEAAQHSRSRSHSLWQWDERAANALPWPPTQFTVATLLRLWLRLGLQLQDQRNNGSWQARTSSYSGSGRVEYGILKAEDITKVTGEAKLKRGRREAESSKSWWWVTWRGGRVMILQSETIVYRPDGATSAHD